MIKSFCDKCKKEVKSGYSINRNLMQGYSGDYTDFLCKKHYYELLKLVENFIKSKELR